MKYYSVRFWGMRPGLKRLVKMSRLVRTDEPEDVLWNEANEACYRRGEELIEVVPLENCGR